MAYYTLPLQQFQETVNQMPNTAYLHQPINRQLHVLTWKDVEQQALSVASYLQSQGLAQGDKVGIFSKNCAEWFITDIAIMMAGLISVPIYHTANRTTIEYILEHSDCKTVFVGKLDGLTEAEAALANGVQTISFPYPTISCQTAWEDVIKSSPLSDVATPQPSDTMSIVYTSGSTGTPKGVVLSFANLAAAASDSAQCLNASPKDHLMSYLPLAHITERSLIETASYYAGNKIFFVESLDTFIDDVKVAQPSLFVSVPRLWSKFQAEVLQKMPDKKLQILLKIPVINKLVAKKIRTALGLNNAREFGSGSAPISPAILQWYKRLGIGISEGWGMTETSGMSCVNLPFNPEGIGSIGKPLNCVEMKIDNNQEILIRGAAVFKEYYNNPQETAKSFTDDWFHTGDMGNKTEAGHFEIIGRVKEQFKTAKGKYVAPVPIESLLAQNTDIEQICVMGQGRKQPIALVVLNEKFQEETAELTKHLAETLTDINGRLESHQKLDTIIVLKDSWTVENELLTPTLKIKRNEIEKCFNHYLEADITERVFWEK